MKIWKKDISDFVGVFILLSVYVMYYQKVFEAGIKTSVSVKFWGLSFFVIGLFIALWRRKDLKKLKTGAIILTSLIIILGLNILLFDYLNIVVQYEDWIKRGMP